jgi:hypothetical protein
VQNLDYEVTTNFYKVADDGSSKANQSYCYKTSKYERYYDKTYPNYDLIRGKINSYADTDLACLRTISH